MSQTTYNKIHDAGVAGLQSSGNNDISGFMAEEALDFGVYVTKGTDPEKQVKLPADATAITDIANVRGIVVRSHVTENDETTGIALKDAADVLRSGEIWVRVEETVTPDDAVFVRYTAETGKFKGHFRTDDGGGKAAELPNANWVKGGSSIALLRIKL
jgi:hypothetical protein